jgi:MtrB/PioB family decaheme-associated outer membrane protein
MKTRTGLLVTTALSALAIGLSCGGQALAAEILTKAPPPALAVGWWSNVYVEIGGRFFLQNDGGGTGGNFLTGPNGPTTHLTAGPFPSLGKFYEYRDLRPGPIGEIFATGGSRDGLYQYDFRANNIGYRDQRYVFDWSQAGVQYLTLGFDQIPHTYNNNATTIFQGAGSNTLTVPSGLQASLAASLGVTNPASGSNTVPLANATAIANAVEGNLNSFRLGFERTSGFAEYRYTPTDNWDARVDYNITSRDGTQPIGALTYNGVERGGRIVLELPKPIHDETHNANANVEYAGVTPWGKKFNVNFGYGLSVYHQDADFFTFQNPFVTTNGANTPLNNIMSQPPSNTANTFLFNGGLDLPMKSRWVAAVNYTHGDQNANFLPFSINPAAIAGATAANGGIPPTLLGGPGFHSDSLLVNNVLTTKWTSELAQTSRYRYYNYDAAQPGGANYMLLADSSNTIGLATDPDDKFNRKGVAYTKQNASSDFVWHPAAVRWLNVGAGAGWEQWDRDFRGQDPGLPDVAVTNEFTGNLFATAKPWDWSQFRATYIHGERRYEGTYQQFIAENDLQCNGGPCFNARSPDLANRVRDKANAYVDFYAPTNLVITLTGGFRADDYSGGMVKDAFGNGLVQDNTWNAGVEASWVLNPFITLFGSYTHERGEKEIWIHGAFSSNVNDTIDTFIAGANFVVVPDKWDVKVSYTLMSARGEMSGSPTNATIFFPDQTQTLNHVDVVSKYKVDPSFMQQFGFKGETYVKLRYLWERNEVNDWAAVNWNYMYLFNGDATNNKSIELGWNNPNYNAQLLMASLALKW